MSCRFCQSSVVGFGDAIVLGRHNAKYTRCTLCGSVQVEDPTWLDEAYDDVIARSDLGQVSRCVANGARVSALLKFASITSPCLDYSGGSGLFVRLMRDRGFDFYWCDPMAENDFARGFEASTLGRYAVVTMLEVVEHLLNPAEVLAELSHIADVIVVSTYLLPSPAPSPGEWWYYATDTGQHISFPSPEGLQTVAAAIGMRCWTRDPIHIFSRSPLPRLARLVALNGRLSEILAGLTRRPTLLGSDYARVLANLRHG